MMAKKKVKRYWNPLDSIEDSRQKAQRKRKR